MIERTFIVTAKLADDADPEQSAAALGRAIAYEAATTDLMGLAEGVAPGTYDLPDGTVRVELVDEPDTDSVVVTRPEIDKALRQAIDLGTGVLRLIDGKVVAMPPMLELHLGSWVLARLATDDFSMVHPMKGEDPYLLFTGMKIPLTAELVRFIAPFVTQDEWGQVLRAPDPELPERPTIRVFGAQEPLPPGAGQITPEQYAAHLEADAAADRVFDRSLYEARHPDLEQPADELPSKIEGETRTWFCRNYASRERCEPEDPRTDLHADCAWGPWEPDTAELGSTCPDGGRCHHACTESCYRVAHAGPLSGVFPGDEWPIEITTRWA